MFLNHCGNSQKSRKFISVTFLQSIAQVIFIPNSSLDQSTPKFFVLIKIFPSHKKKSISKSIPSSKWTANTIARRRRSLFIKSAVPMSLTVVQVCQPHRSTFTGAPGRSFATPAPTKRSDRGTWSVARPTSPTSTVKRCTTNVAIATSEMLWKVIWRLEIKMKILWNEFRCILLFPPLGFVFSASIRVFGIFKV